MIAVDVEKHRNEFIKRYQGKPETVERTYRRVRKNLYATGKYASENTDTRSLIWRVTP